MASITLRAYNREIEGLIDHGQIDEAIAHCMHILQFVPKHIGTYRLLGKAYLENRQYSDAADIFQRVLSSVPDDFVANIGMSIIREDEKNLEGAIWHMERAFEAQPSNAAVQEELRRLYGRRDGVVPPKVRLTRGALSRMYYKGNLFNQAIGELRAALSEDPHRIDLQVLLAQAYYANGQFTEAVETCYAIIKKLPYCLGANRILAAILTDTDQALKAKEYQQRLISLDPYYASTSPKAASSDEVPEKAVVIEKLEYTPRVSGEAAGQPAWASSLGVTIISEEEQLPEWLGSEEQAKTTAQETPIVPEPEPPEEVLPTPEDQLPEWMKEAGWTPSAGPETPPPPLEEVELPQAEGELAPGEVPDWLKEIAPEGALEEEAPVVEPTEFGEEIFPWLQEEQPGASDTVISWLDKQKGEELPPIEAEAVSEQPAEEELPEWMTGFGEEAKAPAEEIPDWIKEFQGAEEPSSGVTDWLETIEGETTTEGVELAAEEVEEWMKPTAEEPLAEEIASEVFETQVSPAEEEIPDWLKAIEGETPIEQEPTLLAAEQAAPEVTPEAMSEEESLAWLESLARKQGVPEEQLTTSPGELIEEAPVWTAEIPAEEIPVEQGIEEGEETLPEWLKGEVQPEAALPSEEGLEWLKPAEEAAPIEEAPQPAEISEELPDWLKAIEEEVPVEEEPTLVTPTEAAPPIPPEEMDQETAIAWLESLAAKQGVPEEQLTAPPSEAEEETAPWLIETPQVEQPAVEEPEHAESVFPDWLVQATEPEIPQETERLEEEISERLAAIEAEAQPEKISEKPEALLEEIPQAPVEEAAELEQAVEPAAEVAAEEPEEAALAWLESLARKQGVPEEQLVTHPLKPIEEPPAWVKAEAEAEMAVEETQLVPSTVEPEEAPAEIIEPTVFAEEAEAVASTAETVPSWLVSEVTEPTIPVVEEETKPVEIKSMKKLDLNQATLTELEELPGIGFILGQAILNYREEHGPFTRLDDLIQVPGIGPDRIEGIRELVEVIPSAVPARVEEAFVPKDEDEQLLAQGRAAVSQDDLPAAVEFFSILVQKKILLPEVIQELLQAVKHRPDHLLAWQTLGDAFVRNDQLQEALDAYIKAEELLS